MWEKGRPLSFEAGARGSGADDDLRHRRRVCEMLVAKEHLPASSTEQARHGRNDQHESEHKSEDEFKKVRIQALHQSQKTVGPTVRFDENVASYPTDSAERQKQRKKDGYVPNKKVIKSEVHHDDCGDDLSGIMGVDAPQRVRSLHGPGRPQRDD